MNLFIHVLTILDPLSSSPLGVVLVVTAVTCALLFLLLLGIGVALLLLCLCVGIFCCLVLILLAASDCFFGDFCQFLEN